MSDRVPSSLFAMKLRTRPLGLVGFLPSTLRRIRMVVLLLDLPWVGAREMSCPQSTRRKQGLSLAPKPAYEIGGRLRGGEARRLSGPGLHAIDVAGLRCCIAHRLRQRSLYRIGCRLWRLWSIRGF